MWGDYRDSNPGKQLHKLLCYRYTIVTIRTRELLLYTSLEHSSLERKAGISIPAGVYPESLRETVMTEETDVLFYGTWKLR